MASPASRVRQGPKRAPITTDLVDGKGRSLNDMWMPGHGVRAHGPHGRRWQRKTKAWLRGWDAYQNRCPHHPPICPYQKQAHIAYWREGVRSCASINLYTEPEDYCECECDECVAI